MRSEERGVSGVYALCWKRDSGEVNMVWIPTEAGRASWSKTHHLTGKQVSWRLSSMTTPHAITTFGGATGGTDAWGRGVNVLIFALIFLFIDRKDEFQLERRPPAPSTMKCVSSRLHMYM